MMGVKCGELEKDLVSVGETVSKLPAEKKRHWTQLEFAKDQYSHLVYKMYISTFIHKITNRFLLEEKNTLVAQVVYFQMLDFETSAEV